MNHVNNLLILSFLAIGIFLEFYFEPPLYFISLVSVVILVTAFFIRKVRVEVLFVLFGLLLSYCYNYDFRTVVPIYKELDGEQISLDGEIVELKEYPFATMIFVKCRSYQLGNSDFSNQAIFRLYFSYKVSYKIGDYLNVVGKFRFWQGAKNIGEFDPFKDAKVRQIAGYIDSFKHKLIPAQRVVGYGLYGVSSEYIKDVYHDFLNYRSANFQKALFLGVKSSLDKEELALFADSSTLHLLAVSGMHVGFLLMILLYLCRGLGLGRDLSIYIVISGLLFYVFLVGCSASVVRAFLMASFWLLSYRFKRIIMGLDLLACAGMVALLWQPNQLFMVSFQLSYLAVLSIILIYQRIKSLESIDRISSSWFFKPLVDPLLLSIAIVIGTTPFIFYLGSKVNLLAVFLNVFIIPLTALSYILGVALLALCKIPVVADFAGYLLDLVNDLIFASVELFSLARWAIFQYDFSVELVIASFALIAYFLIKKAFYKIMTSLIAVVFLIIHLTSLDTEDYTYFFSLKKGMAFWRVYDKERMLYIDGVTENEFNKSILPFLRERNVRVAETVTILNCREDLMLERELLFGEVLIDSLSNSFQEELSKDKEIKVISSGQLWRSSVGDELLIGEGMVRYDKKGFSILIGDSLCGDKNGAAMLRIKKGRGSEPVLFFKNQRIRLDESGGVIF